MKLTFVTTNNHKLKEARRILGDNFVLHNVQENLSEIQSMEVEEVASHKAACAFSLFQTPLFCEDVALYIQLVNGNYFPGPFVKYYIAAFGLEKLVRLHAGASAYAIAVISYHDGKSVRLFVGRVDGYISDQIRGKGGFGFDPIFVPAVQDVGERFTFAQMDSSTKNRYSHRNIAMIKMKDFLLSRL